MRVIRDLLQKLDPGLIPISGGSWLGSPCRSVASKSDAGPEVSSFGS